MLLDKWLLRFMTAGTRLEITIPLWLLCLSLVGVQASASGQAAGYMLTMVLQCNLVHLHSEEDVA